MMERTRIAKVQNVRLVRRGEQVEGTLHLTPHHLIFCHLPPDSTASSKPRELWITYPIIQKCTLRQSPAASRQPSSIRLQCRDFTFICFCFEDEKNARDAYESIRSWTCRLGHLGKLYAFDFEPQRPEKDVNGWHCYNAKQEWYRQGISEKLSDKGWRISNINNDYSFSPTYPSILVVPSSISDNTLNYAVKYRSRGRLPVLTYLHPINNCSMTRCAQPLLGVRQNRSAQDEKLVMTIFSTSHPKLPASDLDMEYQVGKKQDFEKDSFAALKHGAQPLEASEDDAIARAGDIEHSHEPKIYGAQQNNLIVDARPTVNALAMQAMGMGSENMDNYKFATKIYLGIDNIHVMRDSLSKVVDSLKETDLTPLAPSREALSKSNWLKHISQLLDGARIIAKQIGLQHSHVLIHCSDGWDRTSQLSALSQICLDPYYRTIDGLIVLIEKDWLSFGHQFALRSGYLSSEKWFNIDNERVGGDTNGRNGVGVQNGSAGHALENALLSAKGFFNKDSIARDTPDISDGEFQGSDLYQNGSRKGTPTKNSREDKPATKVKETSPIFHQFLDAIYQLLHQHSSRFEYNERFLRRLLYHLYSCQYGTFLYNCEKERLDERVQEKTRSVWDYFISRREQFTNDNYDASIDDNMRGKERLILPSSANLKWWSEAFGRPDFEMNGPQRVLRPLAAYTTSGETSSGALTGVETASVVVTRTEVPHEHRLEATDKEIEVPEKDFEHLAIDSGTGDHRRRTSSSQLLGVETH